MMKNNYFESLPDTLIPNWGKNGILQNVVSEARQLKIPESRPGF